jgi:hypothetical protein
MLWNCYTHIYKRVYILSLRNRTGWKDWIHLAQDRDQWWVPVNMVRNSVFHKTFRNCRVAMRLEAPKKDPAPWN